MRWKRCKCTVALHGSYSPRAASLRETTTLVEGVRTPEESNSAAGTEQHRSPVMNLTTLDLKIRQMHAALGALNDDDISGITVQSRVRSDGSRYLSINPNQGTSPEEIMNVASQLLANIPCLN